MSVDRPYNFSPGPAILPLSVLERAAEAVKSLALPDPALEARLSILEISHRSPTFERIHERAIERIHDVIRVPRTHRVLFLQGGASLQFAMVPMNLRQAGRAAAYVDTGVWSKKAIEESQRLGPTEVIASSKATRYDHIPAFPPSETYADASYVHITTNNTIYGTEYVDMPKLEGGVPLVSDLSSHIGSRPMHLEHLALGYAGAQKNLGPSGLTIVFIESSLLDRTLDPSVPTMLRYAPHAEANSLLNTPNTFAILVLDLMLEWIAEIGGLEGMEAHNRRKAEALYAALDRSPLYRSHARKEARSLMNVTWTLAGRDEEDVTARTKRFLVAAERAGMCGLKGHRSVGGCRASIYNAFPQAGVDALCEFMREFERQGG